VRVSDKNSKNTSIKEQTQATSDTALVRGNEGGRRRKRIEKQSPTIIRFTDAQEMKMKKGKKRKKEKKKYLKLAHTRSTTALTRGDIIFSGDVFFGKPEWVCVIGGKVPQYLAGVSLDAGLKHEVLIVEVVTFYGFESFLGIGVELLIFRLSCFLLPLSYTLLKCLLLRLGLLCFVLGNDFEFRKEELG